MRISCWISEAYETKKMILKSESNLMKTSKPDLARFNITWLP